VITGPRTVLVVAPDPATLTVLGTHLPAHLPDYAVAVAASTDLAIDHLRHRPVDVLVTDLSANAEGGTALLRYVREHHPNLALVALSANATDDLGSASPRLGLVRIVRTPAAPGAIATAVVEAHADVVRGRIGHVALATVLNLMQLERKTCSLLVRSGEHKGRLHFLAGELVNAYSFELDTDGERAARHLLTWDTVSIDFERSLHNHERRIRVPLQELMLQVATDADDAAHRRTRPAPAPAPVPSTGQDAATRLEGALSGLSAAVRSLRDRQASSTRTLAEAGTQVEAAGEALDRHDRSPTPATDTDASSLRDVAQLARRMAKAAERLEEVPEPEASPQ
jgi:CheY-like chemotaxis protein